MAQSPEGTNPGSYSDFLKQQELSYGAEALSAHSEALKNYRLTLAAFQGIDIEDLHSLRNNTERSTAA